MTKIKFQGSGLYAYPKILSFRWLICEYIYWGAGGEALYFRRDMHLKVPSSLVLALMADGLPNLCSKKLVDSHMHFSAEHWNYFTVNTCIEFPLWSTKGWWYWKCIFGKSPEYNFGHCGPKLEHFTNKNKWKMAPVPKNADFGAAHGLYKFLQVNVSEDTGGTGK